MWELKRNPVIAIRSAPESTDDVSLFRGGLFYRGQALLHLIGPGRSYVGRQVAFILAVSWLPLVILTAVFSPHELVELLTNYMVYSRVAVAVPVLLIGQLLMDNRFSAMATHVRRAQLIGGEDLRKLDAIITTLRRLRDSLLPELIIAAFIFAELALLWPGKLATAPAWAADRSSGVAHMTATGWYYWLISVPLYQFLLLLNLWKWLLWSLFLFRLSRMDLRLVATHPDAHGGLGFLGLSAIGFTPIAIALSTAIGGTWRDEILNHGASLNNFRLYAIVLFVLMFTIAL